MIKKCPPMIKRCSLLMIAFMLLILGGCSIFSGLPGTSGTSAGKIMPPPNQTGPFSGKWTVLEELGTREESEDIVPQWTGSSVQFAEGVVAFDDTVWDKVSYKIKRVDAADYLTSKYISDLDLFNEETERVEVVTVYAADNYLGEFMKIDELSMVFFVQDTELLLKKISNQADSKLGTSIASVQSMAESSNGRASGVLLGLRIPGETGYTYRTLWIAADHDQMHPVLVSEKIFFPRTSGFWDLSIQQISSEEKGNLLTVRNVAAKTPETEDETRDRDQNPGSDLGQYPHSNKLNGKTGGQEIIDSSEKIINYIGNDYVAIEKNSAGVSRLQVLPVDNLSSPTKIKFSDLLGEKGLSSFLSARRQAVEALGSNGIRLVERDDHGENFGLARKNGHWLLVGRINYQSDGTPAHTDFDLKIVPPFSLISYDTLVLSWYKIKNRVPDAMDAFTSPNKDIALVKTKNKIAVYKIGAEQLTENPLAEIELQKGATVIMAEWAIGSYVESWENSFLSYGAEALSEN